MDPSIIKIAAGASAIATALTVALAVRAFLSSRNISQEEKEILAQEAARDQSFRPQGLARHTALAQLMRPKTVDDLNQIRLKLAQAGLRNQDAINLFSVIRVLALFGGLFLFLPLIIFSGGDPLSFVFGSVILLIAFMGPSVWLNSARNKRQEALNLSLPPTLDLLVTCIDAGLGLEQALARVAAEIGFSDPEMAEELSVVVGEVRAGLSVGAAFRKLSERVTSDEVRNLSSVVIQSSVLGAALGKTLREYSTSARNRREMVLEEVAGKVTAGLTLPLTLCLLPSAILAMLGPAVVIVFKSMF